MAVQTGVGTIGVGVHVGFGMGVGSGVPQGVKTGKGSGVAVNRASGVGGPMVGKEGTAVAIRP